MSALSLLSLNNVDNVVGGLYLIVSGLKIEEKNDVIILTKADHVFSLGFAVPHVLWVVLYGMVFLGAIPI